jgi:hypothetical protein
VGFIRQGLRDFQCCLHFPECGLNVPEHIQPGLVDGFVKPCAMGAVEALYVIRARGLATAQQALQSWGAVRFIDQLVRRGSHFLIQNARHVPEPNAMNSKA